MGYDEYGERTDVGYKLQHDPAAYDEWYAAALEKHLAKQKRREEKEARSKYIRVRRTSSSVAQELRHRLRGGGRRESIRLLVRNGPPPACPDPSRVDYNTSETFTRESEPPPYGLDIETNGEEVSVDTEREEDATGRLATDQLDIPIGRSQSGVESLYTTDDGSLSHMRHTSAGSAICSPEVTGIGAATIDASDHLPDERDRSRTTTHEVMRRTQAEKSAGISRAAVNSDDASHHGSIGGQQA